MTKPTSFSSDEKLILKLYISGMSPKSMEAIKNLKLICENYINDRFELEIIDIYKNPALAAEQHIIFCPSLVKQRPLPRRTLIGTLADTEKVMTALGISNN